MRVINETNWRTDQLKKLAMEVAYRESSLFIEGRKNLKITFRSNKSTRVLRGYSAVPGWVRIKIPKIPDYVPGVEWTMALERRIKLAQTLTWAIGIAVGLRGKDMNGLPKYSFDPNYRGFDWVDKFPIEQKVPTPKFEKEVTKVNSELERRRKEVEVARNRVEQWEKRSVACFTKILSWRREVKRAEKKLAEVQTTVVLEPEGKPTNGRKFRKPELVEA